MKGEVRMTQNVAFNFDNLRHRIIDKVGSNRKMADLLGITEVSFSRKINGKTSFSAQDVYTMSELLEISADEIGDYFFVPKN